MKQNILFTISLFCCGFLNSQVWNVSEPLKLTEQINSPAEESTPFFSPDSSILYFTRTFDKRNAGGEFDQDIWFSMRNNSGVFSEAIRMKGLNNKNNNAVIGVNQTGVRLYLLNAYNGKSNKEKGLAVSEKKSSGKWGKPSKVQLKDLTINSDFCSFFISKDETVIIISYNGKNSEGEEDLYVVEKSNNGWTSPIYMGNVINSPGFEISPFLNDSKDTLYFSSNGHDGLGDADIFYSVRTGESWSDWSEPVNLGAPINSSKFDAYFSIVNNEMYWSSNRSSEKADIFKSRLLSPPKLEISCSKIDISSYQSNDGVGAVIVKNGVKPYSILWSQGATSETISGLQKGNYAVMVTDALNRNVSCEIEIIEPLQVAFEQPVKNENQSQEEVLIYFELNSSYLNAENKKVLQSLLPKLKENLNSKVLVESHCDIRANIPYNIWLSERRMQSTKKYLAENGIDPSRISGQFFGKSQPKINCGENCTEEEYRINRRTVIRMNEDK